MTNQQKPEALRLANYLEEMANELVFTHFTMDMDAAAVELRRLHGENERLAALVEAQQPAPSAAAVQDEREAFEAWYCDQMRAAGYNADDGVANLREGNHYGEHRVMLNGKWEGWQARAARATADSVTAPAGGAVAGPGVLVEVTDAIRAAGFTLLKVPNGYSLLKLGDVRAQSQPPSNMLIKRGEWDSLSTGAKALLSAAAPTQPAQAADSAQEDAARYRWLRDCNLAKFPEINTDFYLGNKNLDAAIDAAMKAGGAR